MAMQHFTVSKVLTPADTTDKVMLPTAIQQYVQMEPGTHFIDLQVFDSKDQEWQLRYYTRPTGNRRNPVFTSGWLEFVRAKGIRAGDTLLFSGHQVIAADGEPQMQYHIRVTRPSSVTFQGQSVDLDVENFPPPI